MGVLGTWIERYAVDILDAYVQVGRGGCVLWREIAAQPFRLLPV